MNQQHYKEVIDNLHLEILHQYKSVRAFCQKFGHNVFTLSRIFNGHQNMSIGLFLKICVDLGKLRDGNRPKKNYNITLKEYLEVNHSEVLFAIMNIHTS